MATKDTALGSDLVGFFSSLRTKGYSCKIRKRVWGYAATLDQVLADISLCLGTEGNSLGPVLL